MGSACPGLCGPVDKPSEEELYTGAEKSYEGMRQDEVAEKKAESRLVCYEGSKCSDRGEAHLTSHAHPFDADYEEACRHWGADAEKPSLLGLFNWADVDGSGKVSLEELHGVVPLLSQLAGEEVVISAEAWRELDEDGSGVLNFSEFAEWAGPRLGLPLGVDHLFGDEEEAHAHCTVNGCPCRAFDLLADEPAGEDSKKRKMREKKIKRVKKKHPADWQRYLGNGPHDVGLCFCGHKRDSHHQTDSYAGHEVPFPKYWESHVGSAGKAFLEFVPETSESLAMFQKLLDNTYKHIWTRDRRKHGIDRVPKGYTVVGADRIENSKMWKEYCVRRAHLKQDLSNSPEVKLESYSTLSARAWSEVGEGGGKGLESSINEWYLFHGTQPATAKLIGETDFKMSLAGGNTGTLYGRGTYFAESITKADEYAKADENGHFAVLLVRAVGGHVKYTDEITPDPEELVRSCIEDTYSCVLGDREKCRGTFREFVFFDSENIYAEYIIRYTRRY